MDLDIWCDGVKGALGKTVGPILGSAQFGVGALACSSGVMWLTVPHTFSVPVIPHLAQGHAEPPVPSLPWLPLSYCVSVSSSISASTLTPSVCFSSSLAASLFLWVQLLDSQNLLASLPLHLSQHLSVSLFLPLCLSLSLCLCLSQHLCLCLPLAGFRSD